MPKRNACPLLVPALAILAAGTVAAQSLADVARAEEARRRTVTTRGKVYTNDSPRGVAGGQPSSRQPAAAEIPRSGSTPAGTVPPTPQTVHDRAKDENHWRERMATARTELQRSQAFYDALQSQIQGLYTQYVATDDPAQRAMVEKKRLAALAEQERVKGDIGRRTKAIADIEDEARRASVPAGWLR
jgi:hypothetical protein